MIFKSFNGLRYEAMTPSRFLFRLGEGTSPIELSFNGLTWMLSSNGKKSYFLSRDHATAWLAEEIAKVEAKHETNFTFAHLLEDYSR